MKWSKEMLTKPFQSTIQSTRLSATIYTRRSRRAQGGTWCQLWRMVVCTWSWGHGEEPSLWTQTCSNGNGVVLGMQHHGNVFFKCASPHRSIAKCGELAKYSKKHAFKKYRQNHYIQTTASRCLPEHLEIITRWKSYFFTWLRVLSLSAVFSPRFMFITSAQYNQWKVRIWKNEIHNSWS